MVLLVPAAVLVVGVAVVGHVGDGDLYGPRDRPYAPTVLELRTPAGVMGYDLVGGP